MSKHHIVGTPLKFLSEVQVRFVHLEEHFDIPAFTIDPYDFFFRQIQVGAKQSQPLFRAISVTYKNDSCLYFLIVIIDSNDDNHRG